MQVTEDMVERGARAWCPYKTKKCPTPCQVCMDSSRRILAAALRDVSQMTPNKTTIAAMNDLDATR